MSSRIKSQRDMEDWIRQRIQVTLWNQGIHSKDQGDWIYKGIEVGDCK